jgi:hypothetical protein
LLSLEPVRGECAISLLKILSVNTPLLFFLIKKEKKNKEIRSLHLGQKYQGIYDLSNRVTMVDRTSLGFTSFSPAPEGAGAKS